MPSGRILRFQGDSGDIAMNGSVVVITGAFGALGSAVARALDEAGARLVLVDAAAAVPEALQELAGSHRSFTGVDLTSAEQVKACVERIVERFSPVDGLVNIAGGFAWETTADGQLSTWDTMYSTNVQTAFNMCHHLLPHMRAEGGRILNVGAGAAHKAVTGMGAYAAAKAGVLRLTEALADEVKDQGITVNAILPGVIDTPANRQAMPDADRSRWVTPHAIADVVMFML